MKSFEYNGYHFTPVRSFTQNENADWIREISPYLESSPFGAKLLRNYGGGFYSHGDFYKAAGKNNATIDVFQCIEDGTLRIPAGHEIFVFTKNRKVN